MWFRIFESNWTHDKELANHNSQACRFNVKERGIKKKVKDKVACNFLSFLCMSATRTKNKDRIKDNAC